MGSHYLSHQMLQAPQGHHRLAAKKHSWHWLALAGTGILPPGLGKAICDKNGAPSCRSLSDAVIGTVHMMLGRHAPASCDHVWLLASRGVETMVLRRHFKLQTMLSHYTHCFLQLLYVIIFHIPRICLEPGPPSIMTTFFATVDSS